MAVAATTEGNLARSDIKTRKASLWGNLGFQVAVSMVLGIAVGLIWPEFAASLKILGDLFLRLIKTAVAPLVFLTVAVGIGMLVMSFLALIVTVALYIRLHRLVEGLSK